MIVEEKIEDLEKKMDEVMAKLDLILCKSETAKLNLEKSESIKKESPREFFLKFNPKKDTEKALVSIYYLEKQGIQSITTNEIAKALKEMRETLPKNISDKIQLLDKRALVRLSGNEGRRKCWVVSNKGEEFLRRIKGDG